MRTTLEILETLKNPEVFEINRINPHSDHDFYTNEGKLRQCLNGQWDFGFQKAKVGFKFSTDEKKAVEIRNELKQKGVELIDTKEGTTYQIK